jgi:small-conductance mechanosensitive channel
MPAVTVDVAELGITGLTIGLIVVVGIVAYAFVRQAARLAVRHLLDREAGEVSPTDLTRAELEKRIHTVQTIVVRSVGALIAVVVVLMSMDQLGVDIGPALAGFGVVGLAISLGSQSLVRDWLGGILILAENQYSAGDVIEVNGVAGTVEAISLRRTVLRAVDGTVHSVANGDVRVSSNRTKIWSGVNVEVKVGAGTDATKASAVINEVGSEMQADPEWGPMILEPPHVDRITEIGADGITFLVLGSARAKEQWKVAGELRRRLLEAFAREQISF